MGTDATPTTERVVAFGGLQVRGDRGVLAVRPWTLAQARCAAELVGERPGPVIELFAGGGHIGLETARQVDRDLVQIEIDPVACALARTNADANSWGARTRVECRPVTPWVMGWLARLEPSVLIADPPYVPTAEVARFPGDPVAAIDGGSDGASLLRATVLATASGVAQGVALVLQLGGARQLPAVADAVLEARHRGAPIGLCDVRVLGDHRALAVLGPVAPHQAIAGSDRVD
jgi:methylase of polypeptide subunit release factors